MDEIMATLGDEPMNFLFQQHLLDRMPEPIRLQLLDDNPFKDPRATAARADKLMLRLEKPPSVYKVAKQHTEKAAPDTICFYHARFGPKARKCQKPYY